MRRLTNKIAALIPLTLIAFSVALFANNGSCGASPTRSQGRSLTAGDSWETVDVGGQKRKFLVHVPPHIDASKPLPVVILLHGGGGTAQGMAYLTHFNRTANENGFLAVYPEGIKKSWNDGRKDDQRNKNDDVDFIAKTIETLVVQHNVDPGSIFVTGISNGGFFAERLALELPNQIAAVAVVDAGMTDDLVAMGNSNPVPTMLILGTKDPLVPFEGGTIARMFGGRGTVFSAQKTIEFWKKHNGCEPQGKISQLSTRKFGDRTRIEQTVFEPGANGKILIVDVVKGGGHTWPSGLQYMPAVIIGPTTKHLSNEDIWNFFRAQRPATSTIANN